MPRTSRIICDNAVYHILNRGHDRRKLFPQICDFKVFKDIILRYKQKFRFDLYHYCFMSNHFHLLLRIYKGNELSLFMKGICQSYAFNYKRKYQLSGYLFQNRYKSIFIDKDSYLMECARYIERNPVRAGIVNDPGQYHWSSYNFYAKGKVDAIMTPDPTYNNFSTDKAERRAKYVEYVSTTRPYEEILDEKMQEFK
ncbi:MAG: transposase [Actinobacteria bacterium]|nr:transposase [Actinomycetota bacterium]